MNDFLLGLISAAFATNQVVAVSNHVARSTGIHLPLVDVNSPVERELRRVMEADEAAIEDIDEWIRNEQQLQDQGAGLTGAGLELRIEERLKTVDAAYAAFIDRHPDHVRARLAHGSFLNETGREAEAVADLKELAALNATRPYFLLMHVRQWSDIRRVKGILDKLGPEFEVVPLDVFLKMAGAAPTFKEHLLRR